MCLRSFQNNVFFKNKGISNLFSLKECFFNDINYRIDQITDETPGIVLEERAMVTADFEHNKTGNWQNTSYFSFLG